MYIARTNYTCSSMYTLRWGEGKIDSPVQISSGYSGAIGGKRVQISSGHRRVRWLASPSASSDAWRDVTDPIRPPKQPYFPPSIPPPPPRSTIPPSRILLSLSPTRPRLFISIYFDHRIPHLCPLASSLPVTTSGPRSIFYYLSKWFRVAVKVSRLRRIRRLDTRDHNRKIIRSFKLMLAISRTRESK